MLGARQPMASALRCAGLRGARGSAVLGALPCSGLFGAQASALPGVLRCSGLRGAQGSGFRLHALACVYPRVGLCRPRSLRTRRALLQPLVPFPAGLSGWGLTSLPFPPPDASDCPSSDISQQDPPRHRSPVPSSLPASPGPVALSPGVPAPTLGSGSEPLPLPPRRDTDTGTFSLCQTIPCSPRCPAGPWGLPLLSWCPQREGDRTQLFIFSLLINQLLLVPHLLLRGEVRAPGAMPVA